MNIIYFSANSTDNIWIQIILWLVNLTSVVGGVILFTLLLKLVTMPFDFMSKWSMRKNSVTMEQMRPELEKLQKQYADNKDMYSQKMMALYKKNGYSMFGACLPTILTIVFFIIAINGFQAYSGYQNREYFYQMSLSYNNVVYRGVEVDGEYIVEDENGIITVNFDKFNGEVVSPIQSNGVTVNFEKTENNIKVWTENGYTFVNKGIKQDGTFDNTTTYSIREEGLISSVLKSDENNNLTIKYNGSVYNYSDAIANIEGMDAQKFIRDIQEEMSAQSFREQIKGARFLWIKNIWVSDSPLSHPIQEDWSEFKKTHSYTGNDIGADNYNSLIAKLDKELDEPNGYFILIALTILVSFLTQVIMGKTQKAQMELQTVDGQGAQTQKMMKWMMPIMMAVFAFMYTSAFSIYIILSSLISLLSTLLINFIVDKTLARKNKKAEAEQIRGRVYVKKEEPKKEEPKKKKKKKDDKFAHESGNDFLTGTAKNNVRGRK